MIAEAVDLNTPCGRDYRETRTWLYIVTHTLMFNKGSGKKKASLLELEIFQDVNDTDTWRYDNPKVGD